MAQEKPRKFELKKLLGDSVLIKADDSTTMQPVSHLADSFIALYFSAHWCPPCRKFTPQLVQTYSNAKKAGQRLKVVFISSDRDVEAFSEYYSSMPWAAVPFGEHAKRKEIAEVFKVTSIPSLVILGPDGSVINASARGAVAADPNGLAFPWKGNTNISAGGTWNTNYIAAILLIAYFLYRLLF